MPEDMSDEEQKIISDVYQMPVLAKVVSKKTGYPGVGIVVGHMIGEFYLFSTKRPVETYCLWNSLYPDWRYKNVVTIFFEEARKTTTMDEVKFDLKNNLTHKDKFYTEQDIQNIYDGIPKSNMAAYPIDDLEIFEDANEVKLEEGEEPQLGLQEKEKE